MGHAGTEDVKPLGSLLASLQQVDHVLVSNIPELPIQNSETSGHVK